MCELISYWVEISIDVVKREIGLVMSDILNRSNYACETPSSSVVKIIEQLNGAKAISEEFVRVPSFLAAVFQSQEDSTQLSFERRGTRVTSSPCEKNYILVIVNNETKANITWLEILSGISGNKDCKLAEW